jgi:hypothetical protein
VSTPAGRLLCVQQTEALLQRTARPVEEGQTFTRSIARIAVLILLALTECEGPDLTTFGDAFKCFSIDA